MVSGSISLPLPGFFSPFPHGTAALSVAVEYLALDRGRPCFRQGSSCPAVLRYRIKESYLFRVRGFHPLCQAFPNLSTINKFSHQLFGSSPCGPTTPVKPGLGSSDFARRYFRNLRRIAPLLDFFSLSYLDGSLHLVWLYYPILFRYRNDDISVAGLPHSAIRESRNVCFSSRLFAAYHGLLRLTAPRHPP